MADEINRFWIPMAQILPVFILGLVIEARLALLPIRKKKKKKQDAVRPPAPRMAMAAIDHFVRVSYAAGFAIAMGSLVTGFVLSVAVMAGAEAHRSSVLLVLVVAIVGAVLTGLMPVMRLFEDAIIDQLVELITDLRGWLMSRRQLRQDKN